jgi:hypothetical protein
MLALLNSIRTVPLDTPDTGTFADGAARVAQIELQGRSLRERRQNAFVRDYGANRQIAPEYIGYA